MSDECKCGHAKHDHSTGGCLFECGCKKTHGWREVTTQKKEMTNDPNHGGKPLPAGCYWSENNVTIGWVFQ